MKGLACIAIIAFCYMELVKAEPLKGGIPATLPSLYIDQQGLVAGDHGDVEFLTCFAKQLQQPIRWKSYPTARLIEETHNNKIDIIFPMGFTQERRALLIESQAVQEIEDYWVYKSALPDTSNKKISLGVKLGSPQDSYVQRQGFKNILRHNDYSGLFNMLLVGRVAVVALPDVVYKSLISRTDDSTIKFTPYLKRGYGFYLKPQSSAKFIRSANQATLNCRP